MQRLVNVWAAATLLGAVAVAVAALYVWSHGFDARSQPSEMESSVAMKIHDSSIPGRYERLTSPISGRDVNLVEAGGHYREHCSACHGNDGSGDPTFQGIMSPRPTDLRSEDTQGMSDGELYFVIKQGIRWSGMPAFGKPGDDDEHAWKIVAFVRHLPKLTAAEQEQIEQTDELHDHRNQHGDINHGR